MRPNVLFLLTIALTSGLLIGSATAQTGTGNAGGGEGGQSLSPPELGLADAFGANEVFSDDRRVTGQSAGADSPQAAGARAFAFGGSQQGRNIFSQFFGGQQQTQSGRRILRAPVRADFSVIRPDNSMVAVNLQKRFVHIKPLMKVGNDIRVQISDRVATLSGTVNTASEKDWAERITRLEPGISSVRNELKILQPAP